MVTTIQKCYCGHKACDQYTLSTQGGVGFSLHDATLYAAAEEMLAALQLVARHIDPFKCSPYASAVMRAIAKAQGREL